MDQERKNNNPELNAREMMVLSAVVRDYTALALPVSSASISKTRGIRVSSATIRSILKKLEDFGLIRQPHTSAGRIPTDRGYRYFVDHIMKPVPLPAEFRETAEGSINYSSAEVTAILGQACRMLGEVSRLLGVVLAPRLDDGIFKKLELVPVADGKVLMVLTIGSGVVRTVVARIASPLRVTALEKTAAVITARLQGVSLGSIRRELGPRMKGAEGADPGMVRVFGDSLELLTGTERPEQVYRRGTEYIVGQPEFSPPGRLEDIFTCIEDEDTCRSLMRQIAPAEGTGVRIGRENRLTEMKYCSLVVAPYQVGECTGTIGIIGPTRMQYGHMVPLVDYMGRLLSRIL